MTKVDFPFFKERTFWIVLTLFLVLIVPRMLSSKPTNYSYDEQNYHIPEVERIRSHWPRLDLCQDTFSAVSPGYPYFLATVSQVTGPSTAMLRTINLFVSVAIICVLYAWLRMYLGAVDSGLVLAPFAFSNFLVKSSGWVVTDNGALLAVLMALVGIFSPRQRIAASFWASIWAALAIFFRQLYAWLCLPLFLAAVMNPAASRRTKLVDAGFLLIPVGVLLFLVVTWQGLVPPNHFRDEKLVGISATSVSYLLALAGFFGTVYLYSLEGAKIVSIFNQSACRWAALFGCGISLISATNYAPGAGRWGGYLWNLSQYFPVCWDRSLLLTIAAAWGGAVLCRLVLLIFEWNGLAGSVVWGSCLGGWALSFIPNKLAYQRYFEPLLLALLILAVGLIQESGSRPIRKMPLILLGLFQFTVTLYTLWAF